jgi:hypothetical protein
MQVFSQQKLLDFLETYHKGTGNPTKSLTDKENKNLLKILKWLRHYDEYYAIINLKDNKITWSYGIENHLGYESEVIKKGGVLFFRSIIHPFVKEWHNLFTFAVLKMFRDKTAGSFQLRKSRYIINIPVKKSNGKYVFVKQMLLPFQKDEKNNIISYMNVYSIVDEYKGQPLRPRFFENLERKKEWESSTKMIAAETIKMEKNENFTETEFLVINKFIELTKKTDEVNSFTSEAELRKELALKMKLRETTIRTHINNIESKIERLFINPHLLIPDQRKSNPNRHYFKALESFETGIFFLQKSGILSVLKLYFERQTDKRIVTDIF